jgi:hypothetical protein
MTRAEALRWWQAGYQAGHHAAGHEQHAAARWDRLVASYRAQHAADQQARIDALLLEAIDALASLLLSAATTIPATAQPDPLPPAGIITAKTCQNMHTERCRNMCRQRGR